ncbi:MAG TPA: hypothetical protein VKV26_16635 [Dehalococcoidia bacterium]|nr:hypothetical protein [Dehalococcoidia bacterium]
MSHIETWAEIVRLEAALRERKAARRARLGPLPERKNGWLGLRAAIERLAHRLRRRPAAPQAAADTAPRQPACRGRTLAARRVCRVCGARTHGATAFRPGYRPRRCARPIARGKSRI